VILMESKASATTRNLCSGAAPAPNASQPLVTTHSELLRLLLSDRDRRTC
jgi:hypothetical protein